jgi:hypothetical protein
MKVDIEWSFINIFSDSTLLEAILLFYFMAVIYLLSKVSIKNDTFDISPNIDDILIAVDRMQDSTSHLK